MNVRSYKTSDLLAYMGDVNDLIEELVRVGDVTDTQSRGENRAWVVKALVDIADEIDRRIPIPKEPAT